MTGRALRGAFALGCAILRGLGAGLGAGVSFLVVRVFLAAGASSSSDALRLREVFAAGFAAVVVAFLVATGLATAAVAFLAGASKRRVNM